MRLWISLQIEFSSRNVYLKSSNSTPETHFQWTKSISITLWIDLCRTALDSKQLRQQSLREFAEFRSLNGRLHPVDKISAKHSIDDRRKFRWMQWKALKCKSISILWRQLICQSRSMKCRRHTKQCVSVADNDELNHFVVIFVAEFSEASFCR